MPTSVDSRLGMTLAQFAAACDTSPRAVRESYRRFMRYGTDAAIPPLARDEHGDGVRKFCLALPGTTDLSTLESESVIIPMASFRGSRWHTLCVSSQIGCRMGCTFCETARLGLVRQLSAAEIVSQFAVARRLMGGDQPSAGEQYRYFASGIQNVVFMGMGEPLDNFDEVTHAIRVLSEPNGIAMPHAQITVSTVGRVEGIRRLGSLGWPNLRVAISLNAPDDGLRDHLMPINKGSPLKELHRALREYPLARRGLFLIEYVLLAGVNDSVDQARQVAEWCRDLRCVVNLIPYNPQRDAAYATPTEETIQAFFSTLRASGVFVKRRLTHGRDLMGACGQLGNPELRRRRA